MSGSSSRRSFSASINAGMPCSRTIAAASSRVSGSTQSIGPWVVSISASASTRSGRASSNCWATIPPIEWPSRTKLSHPSASASASRSAAMISSE